MLRPALAAAAAAGERAEARIAASPYCAYVLTVSMLASPLRRCVVTSTVMPKGEANLTDFLVQLKAVHVPRGLAYVPDGVLHPRFARRRLGKGVWVCADQVVFRALSGASLLTRKTAFHAQRAGVAAAAVARDAPAA